MKPFLKWVGGKSGILSEIISQFPKKCNTYHEPFLGGGSVLLEVCEKFQGKYERIIASDINESLINLFIAVRDTLEILLVQLEKYINKYNFTKNREETYYKFREKFNRKNNSSIRKLALFIILNKTCFRGLFRTGPNGFNVPFGHYKADLNFSQISEHLIKVSKLIQPVIFICSDFSVALSNVGKNDFVYVDPPYYPEKKSSFVKYNGVEFNHELLFEMLKKIKGKFLMSNSNASVVEKEFSNYSITYIKARRAINSKNPAQKTTEILIQQ